LPTEIADLALGRRCWYGHGVARSTLRKLVLSHQGNLSAIARSLGVSRQAASRRLSAAGLLEMAAAQRLAGGVTGPRIPGEAVTEAADDERERMLRALGATDSDEDARVRLGMARRSFYRKKAALGIDAAAIARARGNRPRAPGRRAAS
jgi:transcriptional regulator of acetoin/glycerol metabolism